MIAFGRTEVDKPYMGPLSYEIEDAAYFFGREREAELLLAKILSSRFTLLHAQSGAGKTSLLNAKVIPGLEEQGWTGLRILLRENPSEAVRITVLLALLPPPVLERAALDRTLRLFWQPGDDPSLRDLLQRFDDAHGGAGTAVPPPTAGWRQALLPMDSAVEIKAAAVSLKGAVRPLFLRLLRGTLEVSQFNEHLQAIVPGAPEIHENTRSSELRAILDDPSTAAAHEQLLGDLYIPSPSLLDFFTNLIEHYGRRRTQFGMVLILDQFEELFTLFTDSPGSSGSSGKQLWRLRWEFIDHLEALYDGGANLPVRYVVSMRDEYIAQLDAVRRFVRDLDASSFHLSFLEKHEAKLAVQEPARLFNYTYSDECYQNILEALVREDRFVEPAPLQIVCERLWRDREMAASTSSGEGIRVISFAAFPQGGTRAILDSFFDEVMESLEPADRAEALDMLAPLVTASGTRNIIARDSLVMAPFKNAAQRLAILDVLTRERVLRVEQRLGGHFVEISHEFLIGSILGKIRDVLNSDLEYGRFRSTLRALERFRDIDFRADSTRLATAPLLDAVHEFRDRINWTGNEWAVELMLRTAVVLKAKREVFEQWAEHYRRTGESESHPILTGAWFRERGRALLTLEELAMVNSSQGDGYSAEDVELVLRSHIRRGADRHRPQIIHWAQEMKRVWQREIPSSS